MWLLLYVTCSLLAVGWTKPAAKQSSSDLAARVAAYAKLHPNTETEPIEECTELHTDDILVQDGTLDLGTGPLNAVVDRRRLWPDGISHYTIQDGVYTADEHRRIEAGIVDLQELTKVNGEFCVRILPRNNEPDYIRVENFSGCSSYIGRTGLSQRISLVPGCVARHGTIMHEFLHAYGFYHEQSRYDRDDYVEINWDNIQPGTEGNFVKYTNTTIDHLGTPYDYGSVMHYGAYGFAVDPNIPTIITKDPDAVIGQRETLSRWDIERVQILYGCIDPADSVYFKHVDKASLFIN